VAAIAIVASEIFPFTANKSGVKKSPEEGTGIFKMLSIIVMMRIFWFNMKHEQDKNICKLPLRGPIGTLGLDSAHA
jgi:hypothetical protein